MQKRQSRRAFLGNAGRLGIAAAGLSLTGRLVDKPLPAAAQLENGLESVRVLMADVTQPLAEILATSSLSADDRLVTAARRDGPENAASGWRSSAPIEAPFAFTHVGAHWGSERRINLQLRTSPDGEHWSAWRTAVIEGSPEDNPRGEWFATLVGANRHRLGQYRLAADEPIPDRITLTFLNSVDGPRTPVNQVRLPNLQLKGADLRADIISREEWGADESIRFSNDGDELWERAYVTPRMMVVHHTATETLADDPNADIRSIYAFHTITRGWGDIGYNALIDSDGNIYEGRRGRDVDPYGLLPREIMSLGVVAAHAYGYNHGSASVSLLGDFQVDEPSDAMWRSLEELLVFQHRRQQIDPRATIDFARTTDIWRYGMSALSGHRDCGVTECPGDFVYRRLPALRERVAERIVGEAPNRFPILEPPTRNVWPGASLTYRWHGQAPFDVAFEGFWRHPEEDPVDHLVGYDARGIAQHAETRQTDARHMLEERGQYTMHVSPADSSFADRVTTMVERQVVLDNVDADVERVGNWTSARTIVELYGSDYEQADAGSGAAFTWLLKVPETAAYVVQACWSSATDRTRVAIYTIARDGAEIGSATRDQSVRGGIWEDLGTFDFAAGQVCEVTVSAHDEEPGRVLIADAVRLLVSD